MTTFDRLFNPNALPVPEGGERHARMTTEQAAQNHDRELWREQEDYYANSIHVTEQGGIGINCGGLVFVMTLRQWHDLAAELATVKAERDQLQEAMIESMDWANSFATGTPMRNGEHAHLLICSGSRQHPAGTVGMSCCCNPRVKKLEAELTRLRGYVQHKFDCESIQSPFAPLGKNCTCGLRGEQKGKVETFLKSVDAVADIAGLGGEQKGDA